MRSALPRPQAAQKKFINKPFSTFYYLEFILSSLLFNKNNGHIRHIFADVIKTFHIEYFISTISVFEAKGQYQLAQ